MWSVCCCQEEDKDHAVVGKIAERFPRSSKNKACPIERRPEAVKERSEFAREIGRLEARSKDVDILTDLAISRVANTQVESQRPSTFVVSLHKTEGNARVGLDTVARISPTAGCALRIQNVKQGLISEWNVRNPLLQVREGDHICEVNGENRDTERMYWVIAVSSELRLLIKESWP